jgi:hypothetical protein
MYVDKMSNDMNTLGDFYTNSPEDPVSRPHIDDIHTSSKLYLHMYLE